MDKKDLNTITLSSIILLILFYLMYTNPSNTITGAAASVYSKYSSTIIYTFLAIIGFLIGYKIYTFFKTKKADLGYIRQKISEDSSVAKEFFKKV